MKILHPFIIIVVPFSLILTVAADGEPSNEGLRQIISDKDERGLFNPEIQTGLPGDSCQTDSDCQLSACASDLGQLRASVKVCCPFGSQETIFLTKSSSHTMCAGFSVGDSCLRDKQCKNNSCGRSSYGGKLQCCPRGLTRHWAYDYCKGMPKGTKCRWDDQCASKDCGGSWRPRSKTCQ